MVGDVETGTGRDLCCHVRWSWCGVQDDGRDLLASATMGRVDFEKAAHLDWPVRVRENVGAMGYGPRFRQDRGRGYASRYLLDKPLNSVGPQVRSDWVSPGSIDFGTCTRCVPAH